MFSGINQLQLILLLPLIGAFIPTKVVQFIVGMNISLNILTFLNVSSFVPNKMQDLNYSQSNSYLYLINLKSGSSLFNCMSFCNLILFIIVLHFMVLFCCRLLSKVDPTRCIAKITTKLYEGMTFGVYVRTILENYLLLLIASLSELYLLKFNTDDHRISKIFAVCVLLYCNMVIMFIIFQIFATKVIALEESPNKRRVCIHWFSGLKESRISRIYSLLFCLRRQLFCVLILLFKDLNMITKISVYATIQFVYMVLCCCLRPFKMTKDAIIDSINELIYLVLCILLVYFNTSDRWSSVISNAYIWIIISNNLVLLIFEIVCCFKCKKRSNAYKENSKVAPKDNTIVHTTINDNNLNRLEVRNESNINNESYVRMAKDSSTVNRMFSQPQRFGFNHDHNLDHPHPENNNKPKQFASVLALRNQRHEEEKVHRMKAA